MISWLELHHLNAFVKIATDALMLYTKSWKNVLKRFIPSRALHRRFLGSFHFKKR